MEQIKSQKSNRKLNKNIALLSAVVIVFCLLIIISVLYGSQILSYFNGKTKSGQNNNTATIISNEAENKIYNEMLNRVLPEEGFQSRVSLGESIIKLTQKGVIDPEKFTQIYVKRDGFPEGFENLFSAPLNKPILLTKSNANFYINLLWPLGLSNYMEANKQSPINGENLNRFASTGGWTLGKEKNGGAYFNKFKIVSLTKEQEDLVVSVAKNIYRPCCGNSTFFQDCNHGSALLGFLQLGVSQGLGEDELYKEALAFNSFWFPRNYVQLGLYFNVLKNTGWNEIDPKLALSKEYSSSSGNSLIQSEVAKIPNLVPSDASYGGGSCGA